MGTIISGINTSNSGGGKPTKIDVAAEGIKFGYGKGNSSNCILRSLLVNQSRWESPWILSI